MVSASSAAGPSTEQVSSPHDYGTSSGANHGGTSGQNATLPNSNPPNHEPASSSSNKPVIIPLVNKPPMFPPPNYPPYSPRNKISPRQRLKDMENKAFHTWLSAVERDDATSVEKKSKASGGSLANLAALNYSQSAGAVGPHGGRRGKKPKWRKPAGISLWSKMKVVYKTVWE